MSPIDDTGLARRLFPEPATARDPEADGGALSFPYRGEQLPLIELSGHSVQLVVLAFPTIRAVLAALAGHPGQAPNPLVEAARSSVDAPELAAIQPIFGRAGLTIPDCLSYDPAWGAPTPAEELDLIGATRPDELASELERLLPLRALDAWRPVLHEPARWLNRYHRALVRVWSAIAPHWKGAGGGLEREVERVSVAIAKGSIGDLLADATAHEPVGTRPHAPRRSLLLDDRGLVVLPQLGGPRTQELRRREGNVLTHVAYRVPGAARLVDEQSAAPSSLVALLGPQRAAILRHLDKPRTVGELAELMFAVPSAATHHTAALDASGLVRRARQGRNVVVHRTFRGTELLALYERT